MILDRVVYGKVTLLNLIVVAVILVVAVLIAKILSIYLRRSLKEKLDKENLEVIRKVVYYGIIIIAMFSVLPMLGINFSGLLVAGGIVGLAIGFASQRVVSNLISGLFLFIERPIRIGSAVTVSGISGVVEDIHIISTTIRTWDGFPVRIPNEQVFASNITNYVVNVARRFGYVIGIRYSDDAEKAIEIIKNLVEEHPLALKNPAPFLFVDELGESSVNIVVKVWTPVTEWFGVKAELLWKIKQALEKEGIEIPFPQSEVWFANELKRQEIKDSDQSSS